MWSNNGTFFIDSLNSTHIRLFMWTFVLTIWMKQTNKHVMKSMFHSNTCALLKYSHICLKKNESSKNIVIIIVFSFIKRNKREKKLLQILCRQKSVKCQRQVHHCYLSLVVSFFGIVCLLVYNILFIIIIINNNK